MTMHAKVDDATRAVAHVDEHPMAAQDRRLTSKQIETPQAVLRVTEDRDGWYRLAENAPHHVPVDRNAEGQGDLLSDRRDRGIRVESLLRALRNQLIRSTSS